MLGRLRPRGGARRSTQALQGQPAIGARRIGGPVGGTELAQIGRQRGELLGTQPLAERDVRRVGHPAEAVGDHQAAQPIGKASAKSMATMPPAAVPTR